MRSFFDAPQAPKQTNTLNNNQLNIIHSLWHIPSKAQEKHKNDDDTTSLIGPARMHVAFL
ncbi:hypothetical protein [Pedobacter sp.]|uniref:hypothetical protein n=1 Tax=Pedobacter sp. TaxID=1411316 RepID=UPI0031D50B82